MIGSITKPELALLQIVSGLENNPAAPMNIKKDPTVIDRLLAPDFRSPWTPLTAEESMKIAGKDKYQSFTANPGINKVRRLFKFDKPYCDETVDACTTNICDVSVATTEQVGYLEMGIDKCASKSWKVSPTDLKSLDETTAARRADYLRRAAYALKVDANKKIIQELYGMISDYADGTSGLTATKALTLISDKGDILPVSKAKIDKEYRLSKFNGDYVMFGGETMADYFAVRNYRLSPEGKMGVQDAMSNLPFVYNTDFDPIIQGLATDELSHAIIVPFGSVILDTWNEHTGEMEFKDPNYIYTTLEIDGVLYDYSFKFDECLKVYNEMLTLHWGIGSIPDAVYCDGNGLIRHYTTNCGPVDCDVLG